MAVRKTMVCSGSHVYRCWNSLDVRGDVVIETLSRAILEEVLALPAFDSAYLDEGHPGQPRHGPPVQVCGHASLQDSRGL